MRLQSNHGPRAQLATTLAALTLMLGGLSPSPAAVGAEPTQPTARRPAGVPSNYVITPAGYMDPACVLKVSETQVVLDDPETGGLAIADISANETALAAISKNTDLNRSGAPSAIPTNLPAVANMVTAEERASAVEKPPCQSARFTTSGQQIADPGSAQGATELPTADGWAVSTQWYGTTMQHLHSEWTVPAGPAYNYGQTIFIFPGFQDRLDSQGVIFQPVLAWFEGGWWIDSWACCRAGYANHVGYVSVTGAKVSGDVTGSSCSNGICDSWMVQILDKGSQRSVTYNTSGTGRSMKLTVGSALEVYGVMHCSALPTSGQTLSSNTAFYDTLGARRYFNYSVVVSATDCGYAGSYGSTTQGLYWNP